MVVPTFVLDAQGSVLIWNRACERLTGVQASEVLGTTNHWKAFYNEPRPCLADLVVQGRIDEIPGMYAMRHDSEDVEGVYRAENWCVMPQRGNELYLAIDAGKILDASGHMVAVVETLRDMTEERRVKVELERLAIQDGLSGLANRRHFDQALATEWVRLRREQRPLTLMMVDVDHFKPYNDLYGHVKGDECLQQVARALAAAVLRPTDVVARYGGEEFGLILPGTDVEGAVTVAERIRASLDQQAIAHAYGIDGKVTVSVGAATLVPDPGHGAPQQLLRMADAALYQAKRAGRNRCVFLPEDPAPG
jgi:diguanylate cyclase (GGDEF)-like protein/PAS domain S-box-containing protein